MKIKVLDHGYVDFVEAWGKGDTDRREAPEKSYMNPRQDYECGIIEAARQSTQGSFRGWEAAQCTCAPSVLRGPINEHVKVCAAILNPGDKKLLSFLYKNGHSTPFEFAGMVLEIQAPIFVFREWHRHRTQSYSEASARYAPLEDLNYIPTVDRILMNAGANKQAGALKGSTPIEEAAANIFISSLEFHYAAAEERYQSALTFGVPKELARMVLPVGRYSKMRATANLRNWLQFLTLRLDPNAQYEIRQYAQAVATLVEAHFPRTYELFLSQQK